jgi:hypothetical protein
MIVRPPIHRLKPHPVYPIPNSEGWGWHRVDQLLEAATNVCMLVNNLESVSLSYVDLTRAFGQFGKHTRGYYDKKTDSISISPGVIRVGWSFLIDDLSLQFVPAKWGNRVIDMIEEKVQFVTRQEKLFGKVHYIATGIDGSSRNVKW